MQPAVQKVPSLKVKDSGEKVHEVNVYSPSYDTPATESNNLFDMDSIRYGSQLPFEYAPYQMAAPGLNHADSHIGGGQQHQLKMLRNQSINQYTGGRKSYGVFDDHEGGVSPMA